jgi:hypothetical protein
MLASLFNFANSLLGRQSRVTRKRRRSGHPATRRLTRRPLVEILEDRAYLSGTWETFEPMLTPSYALTAAGDPTSGLVYALGGQIGSCPDLTTNQVYDPATNSWTTKASMTPRTPLMAPLW